MNSKCVFSLCTFLLCMNHLHGQNNTAIFSVTKYGAVSDGVTDNSMAFLSAWKAACGARGGVVSVPSGTYLVSGVIFNGPCNGKTYFQNQGILRASPGAHYQDYWISFYQVDGLRIYGRGTFDGNGPTAWPMKKNPCTGSCGHRPTSIKISKVTNLTIEGVTSLNSKQFHFHIAQCQDVLVSKVYIKAPGNSPNTDGIHVARSTAVKIIDSIISTGDDCISIGDGSENIDIESVTCGPGHGISIGSLGKYPDEKDVRGITVKHCNLTGTTNGLRIKTWAPSSVSSMVFNVTFEDINISNVNNPIIINQYYCPESGCSHPEDSKIKIEGVKFINVKGTSKSPVAVDLQCSKSTPCQNLVFEGLGITTATGKPTAAVCSSADYKFVDGHQDPRACAQSPSMRKQYFDDDDEILY